MILSRGSLCCKGYIPDCNLTQFFVLKQPIVQLTGVALALWMLFTLDDISIAI